MRHFFEFSSYYTYMNLYSFWLAHQMSSFGSSCSFIGIARVRCSDYKIYNGKNVQTQYFRFKILFGPFKLDSDQKIRKFSIIWSFFVIFGPKNHFFNLSWRDFYFFPPISYGLYCGCFELVHASGPSMKLRLLLVYAGKFNSIRYFLDFILIINLVKEKLKLLSVTIWHCVHILKKSGWG